MFVSSFLLSSTCTTSARQKDPATLAGKKHCGCHIKQKFTLDAEMRSARVAWMPHSPTQTLHKHHNDGFAGNWRLIAWLQHEHDCIDSVH